MTKLKISVRNLIEFILRSGDISSKSAGSSPARLEEGTRAHIAHQKMRQQSHPEYVKEYYLKYEVTIEGYDFIVDGRADGILEGEFIEEIKSTYMPLEEIEEDQYPLHWAQVMFYGFMYLNQKHEKKASEEGEAILTEEGKAVLTEEGITSEDMDKTKASSIEGSSLSFEKETILLVEKETIFLDLTYHNLDTKAHRTFRREFAFTELASFVESVLAEYYKFAHESIRWLLIRNESLKSLAFPFDGYREGQRELAVAVYRTIRDEKKLYAQAPTGTGKTISTVFPALKALGEESLDRIFYLTSKGTGKTVAEETVDILRSRGGRLRALTLTGKDKICLNSEVACDPDMCIYAEGHFDRINACILDMLRNEEAFVKDRIIAYAKKHRVCPFELSLDLSTFSDFIIGDYNYVFDPRVYLRRFFMDVRENYMFLVDEAHNLVDRAREMYSASLTKSQVMEVKKVMKGKSKAVEKSLSSMNKLFIKEKKNLEELGKPNVYHGVPEEMVEEARKFIANFEKFQKDHPEEFEGKDQLLDLFFKLHNFVNTSEIYKEGYLTYVTDEARDVRVKLFCINPRDILAEIFARAKSSVIFSATLSPMKYYMDLLGSKEDDYRMSMRSPFPKENLEVYLDRKVDTRFASRDASYDLIAENLRIFASGKKGNYIAFFPSYKYMNNVYEVFVSRFGEDFDVFRQESSMDDDAREVTLKSFSLEREKSYLAFMVLGGVFAEGIDLSGEALIGAAVIGVGYPQVSFERDLIRDYFAEENLGYEYAYIYPGMNRVLQAGGRVIRSETDQGRILLMDLRYSWNSFRSLLPEHWLPLRDWSQR